MYMVVVVLNKSEYLDDILERFVEVGITGATILESQGMASALVGRKESEIPILGTLRGIIDSSRPYNKTFFSIVNSKELVDRAIDAVNGVLGDIEEPSTGLAFSIELDKVVGLRTGK